MSHSYENQDRYSEYQLTAAQANQDARTTFIRKTYGHLAGAILCFVILELVIFGVLLQDKATFDALMQRMFGFRWAPLVLIGGFILFGWLAQMWANSSTSRAVQYAGLALYIIIEAIIFVPLLGMAAYYVNDPFLIPQAGLLTLLVFGGLTFGVFVTKKDFSFLGGFLWVASFLAIGLVFAGMLFGFGLGLWFSVAMVGLACGFILYDTSNVIHRYNTDQYVAASLALFASVALLFFYILRILMATRD